MPIAPALRSALQSLFLALTVLISPALFASAADGFDPNVDGNVFALALQPDGRVLIAGAFTTIQPNGAPAAIARKNIARVLPDGSNDPSFSAETDGQISAMALQPDGRIVIVGRFTTVNGVARNHAARLETDGTLDPSFDPNTGGSLTPEVYTVMLQSDGKIIIGGGFTTVQPNGAAAPVTRSRIARFNADGSLDPWVPSIGGKAVSFNNLVLSLAQQPDGRLLVGGGFTKLTPDGGTAVNRGRLARFNADGSLDEAYDPNFNNAVNAIVVQPSGKAIVGGSFTTMQPNGAAEATEVLRLKRLNPDGTLDLTWFGEAAGPVNTLVLQTDGYLLVGGSFGSSGNGLNAYAARLRPTGYSDTATFGVNFTVYAFAPQADGRIVLGGGFTAVRGGGVTSLPRGHVARVSLRGGLDADFHPDVNGRLRTVAVQADNQILVGGTFTSVGGLTRDSLARLGANGSVDTSFVANIAGTVYTAIDVADGKVLIGGNFGRVGSNLQSNIARVNPDGSLDGTFQIQAGNTVTKFVRQPDGKVLLIGSFTSMWHSPTSDPINRTYIARLNTDGTIDTDFTPSFDGEITSIAVQPDGKIIASGNFSIVRGAGETTVYSRISMVRLSADGKVDADFTPGVDGRVSAIAVQSDGKIVIGGSFTRVGGSNAAAAENRTNLARFNADGTVDTAYAPATNAPVNAMFLQEDGKLLIGGTFTAVASGDTVLERHYAARLNVDGTPDESFDLNLDEAAGNEVVAFVPMGNQLLVGGAFSLVRPSTGPAATRHRLVRINADGTVDDTFNADVNAASGASIEALALRPSGQVYVGGSFTNISGALATNLARFGGDGAPDMQFVPTFDGPVHAISELPNKGTSVQTQRNGFAWIEANGQLHAGFSIPSEITINSLTSVVVQPDGKILLGGSFSREDEQTDTGQEIDYGVIRTNPDGTLDSEFQLIAPTDTQTAVQTVVLQDDGKILVGGTIRYSTDTVIRSNLVRLNANGTIDTGFQQNIGGAVLAVAVQPDGKIVLGGEFTYVQTKPAATDTSSRSGIARVNPDGSVDTTFNPGANNSVSRIYVLSDGKLLVSGGFTGFAPNGATTITQQPFAAILNADGTLASTQFSLNQQISAFVRQADGKFLVGGYFTRIEDADRPFIARLNADFTLDEDFFPNPSGAVNAVQIAADGQILIGGNFASLQPNVAGYDPTIATPRNGAARLNPDGTIDATFNPNFGGAVTRLAFYNDGSILALGSFINIQPTGALLIGGSFAHVAGVTVSNLTLLGDDGSVSSSFLPNPNGAVHALLPLNDGRLYVAGAFTNIDGVDRGHIARFTVSNLLDPAFAPEVNGDVYAMVLQADGKLVIGGSFTAVDGVNQAHLARLNTDGTLDTSFAPNIAGTVRVLALQRDGRIVYARETSASASVLERVKADGSADASFQPANNGAVYAIATQPDGRIVVGGSFTQIAGAARSYIAGLNADGSLDPRVDATPNAPVTALVVQADGKILFGGQFNQVGDLPRFSLARIPAPVPVVQSFSVDATGTTVTWNRTVGGPEVYNVTFYGSTDGDNFSPIGVATRVPGTGNWQLSGLSIPANTNYYVGARSIGASGASSTSLVEAAWWFYRGSTAAAPTITSATVVGGSTASSFFYAIGANGQPTGYWASGLPAGLTLDPASGLISGTPTQPGTYVVTLTATNAAGSTSVPVTFVIGTGAAPATAWHLLNISCRATVTNEHPLIIGFAINGNAAKGVLLRGVGPTLATQAVTDPLARPRIVLNSLSGEPLLENTQWGDTQSLRDLFVRVGEFPLQSGSFDAALTTTLSPGVYTMVASDAGNTANGGTVLAELYDTGDGGQQFAAMSARGYIDGTALLIGGFVIDGDAPRKVLIRGVGPVLTKSGVTDAVANPTVKVYNVNNQVVAENDDWGTPVAGGASASELAAAAATVGDSPLDAGSKDAAVLVTLPPGIYTAQVSSADGTAGTALVEIYEVP